MAIWFTIWAYVDFLTGPFTFYCYLTEWAINTNAAIFVMLYYAHVVNGDFDRVENEYIEPELLTETNKNKKNVIDLNQ